MAEPKHSRSGNDERDDKETSDVVMHQRSQNVQAQAQTQRPAKPLKRRTELLGKKIVATRPSREGDDGYQLSTVDDQVTVIFEDGGDRVVRSSDLFEPS
jgi:hypothetical protein